MPTPGHKIAVIDCGTNTFNMLIAASDTAEILHQEKIPVKIGKGGIAKGYIPEEACQRAIDAMCTYAVSIREQEVTEVIAFATAAFRNAENREDLCSRIREKSGISIRIIDGLEEARLIFEGVKRGYSIGGETVLIMDIGGGSTEFILCNRTTIYNSWSFELGASRLLEQFLPSDPITAGQTGLIENHLAATLGNMFSEVRKAGAKKLVGSSGFFDTLSEMTWFRFGMDHDPRETLWAEVATSQLQELYGLVRPLPLEERLAVKGLIPFRADMIVVSFLLADFVVRNAGIERIITTKYSLKEGMLFERMN